MTLTMGAIVALLIGINAFYVLAEFSSVSARRSRLRQMADEGHSLAAALLPIVDSPQGLDRYIALCQVGITLSSLVLGAYGQAVLAPALSPLFAWWRDEAAAPSTAAAVVLVGLTVLQVIFGELLPKSIALQFPIQTSLVSYLPMRWSGVLFGWFTFLLNASGLIILRVLGVPQSTHRHIHSPAEIELLVAESVDRGVLRPVERRRLQRALQLTVRTADELMVPRTLIAAIDADDPPAVVTQQLAESPYTRLPVYRGSLDNIIGLVHTRDVAARWLEEGQAGPIGADLQPVLSVPESIRADGLLVTMRERRTPLAIVIDESGGVAGLVTVQDVLRDLLGPITDEFTSADPLPERLPDGRVRLAGRMRLHEAEPYIGLLWEGEATTVGGRVMEELGHLPVAGERVTIDGVAVEVEQVSGRAIVSLLVTPVGREERP
jgi:putative hemolysin